MNNDQQQFRKQLTIGLPLLLAVVLVFGMLLGVKLAPKANGGLLDEAGLSGKAGLNGNSIDEILRYVDAKYVDDPSESGLTLKAIEAILKELDPHTSYIPAEELQAVNEQLEGNFNGIGIEFMVLEDTIVVVTPLAGGPSEAAGILAGDKIITIGDSTVAGVDVTTDVIYKYLRGEKGTQVKVGIARSGQPKLLYFNISRDEIPMYSVDASLMLNEQTGYIKVNRFSATTYDEFVQALERLCEKEGMKNLVLDLRHNPGGYLQQATKMLSQFFAEQGKLLVYTEGRTVKRTEYKSSGRPFYTIDKLVVLIDEGSASASEIVAGAVQDHDRAVVIGRRSFGKGLVQEQYPLRDGSALRLTVARYYTPSGRCIQKTYSPGGLDSYDYDLEERLQNGELTSQQPTSKIEDSTRYYTSNGHVVFGGGGITPDVFVPIDTILLNTAYLEWRQHAPGFVIKYLEQRKSKYQGLSLQDWTAQKVVNSEIREAFTRYVAEKAPTLQAPKSPVVLEELDRFLQARMARSYFGDEGFYRVWNNKDAMVQRALSLLQQQDPLAVARKTGGKTQSSQQ